MSQIIEKIKESAEEDFHDAVDHMPILACILLVLRNVAVLLSSALFFLSLFLPDWRHTFKAIAYFCGAAAYLLECLLLTDCFRTKVPHHEMFMVYSFGPLYILLGLDYIL